MNRKPSATNAPRQARLRERRKAEGWRRITVWLSPEQADTLESFGGSDWLGSTVKAFLESAVSEHLREPARQAALFENPEPAPVALRDNDKAALWQEADSLNASGAEFRGANIAREVRKLKGGTGK